MCRAKCRILDGSTSHCKWDACYGSEKLTLHATHMQNVHAKAASLMRSSITMQGSFVLHKSKYRGTYKNMSPKCNTLSSLCQLTISARCVNWVLAVLPSVSRDSQYKDLQPVNWVMISSQQGPFRHIQSP